MKFFANLQKVNEKKYVLVYKNFASGFLEIQRQKNERHKRDSVYDCHFSNPDVAIRL